jgi:hypothetical protein
MITLNISVCKKVSTVDRNGRSDYGSNGATCGLSNIEIDAALLDDAQALQATIRGWYGIAQGAVEDELARLGSEAQAQPKSQPAPAAPLREPVVASGPPATTRSGRTFAPTTEPPPHEDLDDFNGEVEDDEEEDDGPAPTTGAQLLGWARKQVPDRKGFIFGLGKKLKFPTKVLDWTEKQVGIAYQAARKKK